MSNDLTISSEFRASRISKSGKESYRSALGVITSGNKAETRRLANSLIEGLWTNSTYRPIVSELSRVFAPLFKHNKLFNASFAEACGLSLSAPNKKGMLSFFEAVLRAEDLKPSKGEKAIYVEAMRRIVEAEAQLALELASQAESMAEEIRLLEESLGQE
jgi:hypothetical protein